MPDLYYNKYIVMIEEMARPETTFEELLSRNEKTLLLVKRRHYFLHAIQNELESRTNGEAFRIKNDIVWRMLIDTYAMAIIDLASIYRGFTEDGGIIQGLKQFANLFRRHKPEKIVAPKPNLSGDLTDFERGVFEAASSKHFQEIISQNITKALYEIFPDFKPNSKGTVKHEFIDTLRDRVLKFGEDVITERDKVRAHPFENEGKAPNSNGLTLNRLSEHFTFLQSLLNNIRLVTTSSSLGYSDLNSSNTDRTAQDVCDLVLFGGIEHACDELGINKSLESQSGPHFYGEFREVFLKDNPSHFKSPK